MALDLTSLTKAIDALDRSLAATADGLSSIPPNLRDTVRAILAAHLPEATVFVFGSRARGTARLHSDLDLAVAADAPLPLDRLEALRDAFAASDLPMQVDVVDYRAASAGFRRIIDANKVPLAR